MHLLKKGKSYIWNQPEIANYWIDSAFNISKKEVNFQGLAESEITRGLIAMGQGDFKKSFTYYARAYGYIPYADSKEQLLTGLHINIGATYLYQAEYEKAARYYYLALQYMNNYRQNDINLLMAYNNIADVFIKMKQYDKASDYLNQGEILAFKKKDNYILPYIYVNKAEIEIIKKNYDAANVFLKKSSDYNENETSKEAVQGLLICKGRMMLQLNQPEEAVQLLTKAISFGSDSNPYYAFVAPYYLLGEALFRMGSFKEAESVLTMALHKANGIGIREEKLNALLVLGDIYKALGVKKQELEIRREIIVLQDQLLNKEKVEAINQLEVKYRTAQKDKEITEKKLLITEQKRKIEKNQIWITITLMGLVGLIGIGIVKNQSNKQKGKIVLLQAMIEGEEKERTRIAQELHDGIGGQLAAIQMHCSAQENRLDTDLTNILQMLKQASKEIRETAHNLMPEAIKQFSLEEALFLYCQNINKSNNLKLQLQILTPIPILPPQQRLNIYRIAQETIQNIIKHAHAKNAIIQISHQHKKLNLALEDDGRGFNINETKKGLGLNNIEVRIKTLNGILAIDSQKGKGTTINIEIPI